MFRILDRFVICSVFSVFVVVIVVVFMWRNWALEIYDIENECEHIVRPSHYRTAGRVIFVFH